MARWPFSIKDEEAEQAAEEMEKFRCSPASRKLFEDFFQQHNQKFKVDVTTDGLCEFTFSAEFLPTLESEFQFSYPSEKEETKAPNQERKDNLSSTISRSEHRQSSPTNNPRAPAPSNRFPGRPSTIDKPRTQRPTPPNDPRRTSEVAPKDLTKDFGVLTLEEQRRLDERQAQSEAEKKKKKKRVKTGRDNQVKTRLTDTELKLFSERVKASGLKQGEFMRECLLHEEVHVRSLTEIDAQAFGKLMEISSDLGRIGGLIKGTVMVNKTEFGVLTPGDKEQLEVLIREMNTVKDDLLKVVQNLYGDC